MYHVANLQTHVIHCDPLQFLKNSNAKGDPQSETMAGGPEETMKLLLSQRLVHEYQAVKVR